ncbi:GNAT family N-acetyltransferase, partial [Lacticaseibacillus rhamnosus]
MLPVGQRTALLLNLRDASGGSALGCVALRTIEPSVMEMKRLYVRPSTRGMGLGKRLIESAIAIARQSACAALRLDPLRGLGRRRDRRGLLCAAGARGGFAHQGRARESGRADC